MSSEADQDCAVDALKDTMQALTASLVDVNQRTDVITTPRANFIITLDQDLVGQVDIIRSQRCDGNIIKDQART